MTSLSDIPQWFCVHSKPKCEHIAAANLKSLDGVETYCPRLRFQRSTPRGKVWFVEALFPSYLFARFHYVTHYRAVRAAHNVLRIVEFGGKPSPIPDEVITALQAEMHHQDVREIQYDLQVGDTVELSEGPMRGLQGVVESIASGAERVQVLLEFLGRHSIVSVPTHKVLSDRLPRQILNDQTK